MFVIHEHNGRLKFSMILFGDLISVGVQHYNALNLKSCLECDVNETKASIFWRPWLLPPTHLHNLTCIDEGLFTRCPECNLIHFTKIIKIVFFPAHSTG